MMAGINLLGRTVFLLKKRQIDFSSEPKKILIIRSGAIGDVVMTTPLIKAVRQKFPAAEISYLVGNWSKKVLEGNPQLNRIISFDDKIVYEKKAKEVWKLVKELKKERFDLAFVLDKSYHGGILAYLMGVKQRIGFDRFGEGFAHNLSVFYDGSKYEGDYNLELLEKLGVPEIIDRQMEIPLSEEEEKTAADFLVKNRITGKIIGIIAGGAKNPGQTMSLKRWPLENYISLIKELSKNQEYNFLLLDGPGDKDVLERITSEIKSPKIFDTSSFKLKEAIALMKRCDLVVTHDTGPLHMAAATGTKVIALFGPTPAHRFAPRNAVVLETKTEKCPCYDVYGNFTACQEADCMKKITVEMVLDKIKETI